jgi:hypothetical protein
MISLTTAGSAFMGDVTGEQRACKERVKSSTGRSNLRWFRAG